MSPVYTVGHGSRPLDDFLALLESASVERLVDVRAFPGSRRHPHFGRAELEGSLTAAGIEYVWQGDTLGGRRRPRPDSPHFALRNASFRAYADHMQTEAFRSGAQRLVEEGAQRRIAIMCAERLPWQCHRYMIADYLVATGIEVLHLIDGSKPRLHQLRAEARMTPDGLIYDIGRQSDLDVGTQPVD
jgi:uncharacterized protein (DUF488 family)